jgi:hypothetical protein
MGFPSLETDCLKGIMCELMPLACGSPAIDQRKFNILLGSGAVQEVISLKYKPKVVPAKQGALLVGQLSHLDPFERIRPG